MANRYWVGGTASWDGTAGTKWAETSGGTGGASVPTSADDVFFDANSGAGTVTIATGNTGAGSINCTGFTGTLAGTGGVEVFYGSVTLVAGMTYTCTGTILFRIRFTDTPVLVSAGKTIASISVNTYGSGQGPLTLGDALTVSGSITINSGKFITANYNVTALAITSSNTAARTIELGSSTVVLSGSGTALNFTTSTNLSFNAGTSTIILNRPTGTANMVTGGLTFYNVELTGNGGVSHSITGVNAFNNLTIAAPSSAGAKNVFFYNSQTINGTLSTTGTAGNRRVRFWGATYGLAQTLTINSAPSLTDADFQDIYVVGAAAPISGTRIGDLRGCTGITFTAPKSVYLVPGSSYFGNDNIWASVSGGTGSNDNFPLAQDVAIIDDNSQSSIFFLTSQVNYTGTIDISARTTAFTFNFSAGITLYGDFTCSSSTTISGIQTLTFSGRNTQTLTTAGKVFSCLLAINSPGGKVQLNDAYTSSDSQDISFFAGDFDTQGYACTTRQLIHIPPGSNAAFPVGIYLRSSTVTFIGTFIDPINFSSTYKDWLTLDAGTSHILFGAGSKDLEPSYPITLYDITLPSSCNLSNITCHDLNLIRISNSVASYTFTSSITVNGTLTFGAAPASALERILIRNHTVYPTRTSNQCLLSVNNVANVAQVDFYGISIVGTTLTGTNLGDYGRNSNISFATPKTVYAVGSSSSFNMHSSSWALTPGGTASADNLPLGQDTIIIDDNTTFTSLSAVTPSFALIPSIDTSARTTSFEIYTGSFATASFIGNTVFGSSTILTDLASSRFMFGGAEQTRQFNPNGATIEVNTLLQGVELEGAITVQPGYTVEILQGISTNNYNITADSVTVASDTTYFHDFGSSVITLTGVNTVFNCSATKMTAAKAEFLLSNNTTSSRTFAGSGFIYKKLTIGGDTSTSTTTITGNNQFDELASTKTVAHTIALGATKQTFGKWTVTGTSGNVVTVTGNGAQHVIAGSATSGLDYLAMGTIGFSTLSPFMSPGEFYAGANSTGSNATIIKTAPPTPRTLYWVGGTGNWNDTARWSTSSGGAGGEPIPTSLDDVVFDSNSNATAYTSTINAASRCNKLTIAGPASGNVTLAGTADLIIHDDVTFPATGMTRTYTGAITLSGSTTGKVLTTNGVTLGSSIYVNGVNCEWALGSALNTSVEIRITTGLFDCNTYNITASQLTSIGAAPRGIILGSATLDLVTGTSINFGTTETESANFTFTAGTSQINCYIVNPIFSGNGKTFYNVAFTSVQQGTTTINGANSFNNLSFAGITSAAGLKDINITADQIVAGTFTCSAGTNATRRHFVRSGTIGVSRTLTCAAVDLTDVDFRDITIAGAAAPATGTRLGDCKGNSGITFDAPKTVYWKADGSAVNWSSTAWATTDGGTPSVNNFPLAQDTCKFTDSSSSSSLSIRINASYAIGTIDATDRTISLVIANDISTGWTLYGDYLAGPSSAYSYAISGTIVVAGRNNQTISANFFAPAGALNIYSPGGTVTLGKALTISVAGGLTITEGTFNTSNYNLTLAGGIFLSTGSLSRAINLGSSNVVLSLGGTVWSASSSNLTFTGTGTISLTSGSSKTFAGGGIDYSGITLNQGGSGTLTIANNNTFKTITNTYKSTGSTTISLVSTIQTLTESLSASGESGNNLTLTGSSETAPCTIVLSNPSNYAYNRYINITGVRVFPTENNVHIGTTSTNNGSLGLTKTTNDPALSVALLGFMT